MTTTTDIPQARPKVVTPQAQIDRALGRIEDATSDIDSAIGEIEEALEDVAANGPEPTTDDLQQFARAVVEMHDEEHDGLARYCSREACKTAARLV